MSENDDNTIRVRFDKGTEQFVNDLCNVCRDLQQVKSDSARALAAEPTSAVLHGLLRAATRAHANALALYERTLRAKTIVMIGEQPIDLRHGSSRKN